MSLMQFVVDESPSRSHLRRRSSSQSPLIELKPASTFTTDAALFELRTVSSRRVERRLRVVLYVALTAAAVAVLLLVSARTGYEVHDIQDASAAGLSSMGCNPYDLPGYLHVNLSHEAGNYWKPVGSVDSCDPVDYVSLIRRRDPSVNWLKGKNIVLFGDSVDREHNEHLCWFIQGDRHMIKEGDPLSPAYPVGREKPPQDYKNPLDGSNTWPKDFYQGRPYICRVEELNLNILNVFHYGLRDETAHLRTFPHFYPPAEFTERLDQIVLPLVKNVARTYKTPSDVADLISITPGFWVVQRSWHDFMAGVANETDALRAAKQHELGWSNENLPDELARWIEKRLYEVLIHTAELYPEADRKPLIVWRTLHHIRRLQDMPYEQVAAVDAIGRGIVRRVMLEAQEARRSPKAWRHWMREAHRRFGAATARLPGTSWSEFKSTARKTLSDPLEILDRLRIDNWGSLMLGQEAHFRDEVHPKPLPGSYVYANGLFEQLRLDLEYRPS